MKHLCPECDAMKFAITMGLALCKLCKKGMSSSYNHCPKCAKTFNRCAFCDKPIVSKG